MTRTLSEFVEEVGVHFDRMGLPPMAGRVLGRLLVSDPPEQSSAELEHALQASKGSISSTTTLLIRLGMVERIRLPGDRKHYFMVRSGVWSRLMHDHLEQVTRLRELTERGLEILADAEPGQRERLEEMHSFHAFWEREIPRLIGKCERETNGRLSETAA